MDKKLTKIANIFNRSRFPVTFSQYVANEILGGDYFQFTCKVDNFMLGQIEVILKPSLNQAGVRLISVWFEAEGGVIICHFTTTVP